MISFRDLSLRFDSTQALYNLNADIAKNSLMALVGPNGGGKSTLIKCLLGILQPTSGKVLLDINRSNIAYLPQVNTMDKSFPINVADTVSMGFWKKNQLHRALDKNQRKFLDEVLEKLNLTKLKKASIANLSGGELQKTIFARIMLQNADLILLDEPFVAIDAATTKELLNLIGDWHKAGKTVIVVMHDLHQVRNFFPETFLISKTKIAQGATEKTLTEENLAKALRFSLFNNTQGLDTELKHA